MEPEKKAPFFEKEKPSSINLHDFEGSNSSFFRVKRLEFRLYGNTSCQGIVGCTATKVPLWEIHKKTPYIPCVFRGLKYPKIPREHQPNTMGTRIVSKSTK